MILALSCLHGEAGEKCSLTNELSFHSRRWGRQGAVGSTAAGASAARLPVGFVKPTAVSWSKAGRSTCCVTSGQAFPLDLLLESTTLSLDLLPKTTR